MAPRAGHVIVFTMLEMSLFSPLNRSRSQSPTRGGVQFLAAVLSPTDPVRCVECSPSVRRSLREGCVSCRPRHSCTTRPGSSVCDSRSSSVLTGAFSLSAALAISFALIAAGGLDFRLIAHVARSLHERPRPGVGAVRRRRRQPDCDHRFSSSFGIYLVAERAGCSGILADVASGFTMSYMANCQWQCLHAPAANGRLGLTMHETGRQRHCFFPPNMSSRCPRTDRSPRLTNVAGTSVEAAVQISGSDLQHRHPTDASCDCA